MRAALLLIGFQLSLLAVADIEMKSNFEIQTGDDATQIGELIRNPKLNTSFIARALKQFISPPNAQIYNAQTFSLKGSGPGAKDSNLLTAYVRAAPPGETIPKEFLVILRDDGKHLVVEKNNVRFFGKTQNGLVLVTKDYSRPLSDEDYFGELFHIDGDDGMMKHKVTDDISARNGDINITFDETNPRTGTVTKVGFDRNGEVSVASFVEIGGQKRRRDVESFVWPQPPPGITSGTQPRNNKTKKATPAPGHSADAPKEKGGI